MFIHVCYSNLSYVLSSQIVLWTWYSLFWYILVISYILIVKKLSINIYQSNFRNNLHKTASTSGHARLCVSGIGKSLLSMFFLVIRKAFLTSNGLPESVFMFVDSAGKQMSSSSVSKHLISFQRCEGFEHPYTPTRIRKCICSQIKSPQGQGVGGQLARAVATGLLHTVQTGENYYTVGRRDYVALELHRAIVKFYGLWTPCTRRRVLLWEQVTDNWSSKYFQH